MGMTATSPLAELAFHDGERIGVLLLLEKTRIEDGG